MLSTPQQQTAEPTTNMKQHPDARQTLKTEEEEEEEEEDKEDEEEEEEEKKEEEEEDEEDEEEEEDQDHNVATLWKSRRIEVFQT